MESFSRESLVSLLESVESAINELRSRDEPRLDGVISGSNAGGPRLSPRSPQRDAQSSSADAGARVLHHLEPIRPSGEKPRVGPTTINHSRRTIH